MKKVTSYAAALTALSCVVACSKKDEGAAPVTPITGITFSKKTDTINLNTTLDSSVFTIGFTNAISRQELQNRFKLKMATDSAVAGKDYSISAVITENPLQAKVTVKALPSLARTNFHIKVSLDESMQVGDDTQSVALVIKPFSPAALWYTSSISAPPPLYNYLDSTGKWQYQNGHYTVLDENDAAVLGFANDYVAESGVGFFNMHRLYENQIGSTNIKTARINVRRALELIPDAAGARKGTVRVIPQQITVGRVANSTPATFEIGISGSGTYDLDTKVIALEINFDDTKIGGKATNKYKYQVKVDKIAP